MRGRERTTDGLSVLLLCDDSPRHAPNVLEHIHAIERLSRHRVTVFNPVGIGRSLFLRLAAYDVVVVHYSIFVLEEHHLSARFRDQLAAFQGLKVQFIQDEYRRVDAMTERMRELGIDVVFSSVPPEAVPDVYGSRLPGVEILPTLTGYVPAALEGTTRSTLSGRPLDVVYRGRSIPYWLGRLGQDKVNIGREFLGRASRTDLRCDISWSEADRIYGDEWYDFLASSRTTLGTESGASIVDFDGTLQQRTDAYLRDRPGASFEEVERELLEPFEGIAAIRAISPRVFEAAALGTAMVNFSGRYSDVIEPWVHYIPLEKDFSNFDEVAALIRDDAELEPLAARAHADLVASGSYSLRTFAEGFDREIEARAGPARRSRRPPVGEGLRRRLIAVERLQSRSRVAQLPPVANARARAAARSGRLLISRFPEMESLAEAEPEATRRKLLYDLERLAAATAAHLRELRYLGRPFDVRLDLTGDEQRLTLVGTNSLAPDATDRSEIGNRVALAIREARLEEIVWDNSAVGGALTFATIPISSLDIGYHVVGGAHRFTALVELARSDPEGVIAALEPLFRSRPDQGVYELDRRTRFLVDVAARPGPTLAGASTRASTALSVALTTKELRQLLLAYLRSPEARNEVPANLLLRDILRLRLISESPTSVELDAERKKLVFRTSGDGLPNGAARLDASTVSALNEIVWDHSAAGSCVTFKQRPRVSVILDDGLYEFQALPLIARRFPTLAAPALRRAAGEPPER